ncbi:hypothetical protein TWF730_008424 [Orbilia blumenaviensis]|uniref:Serine protease n=1 Tax=Orbilia blumenaviensis TaxID=1796055 RepID=A0AAV9V3I9_9PEZI
MIDATLNPLFYDPDWKRLPEPEVAGDFHFAQTNRRNEWIVKLEFQQGGNTHTGTGFYLNIPGTAFNVIVTAGHNLINDKGSESKNLKILRPDNESTDEEICKIFISESYKRNPTPKNAKNDYGVILTNRGKGITTTKGFGFSLKLSHEQLKGRSLDVSGYRVGSVAGQPVVSSGNCVYTRRGQIEYKVDTEPGLSGSPVYLPFKGHEVAIAVHHGQQRYAIGTHLDERVLCDIFRFVGVGHEGKCLKVEHKDAHRLGMYLRFSEHREFGTVRLGKDGLDTTFDIFPGYSPPSSGECREPLYLFRFNHPESWPEEREEEKWVLWDAASDTVALTEHIQEFCFVKLVKKNKKPDSTFNVVLPITGEGLVELRMQANEITELDIELGFRETSEISFEEHIKGKPIKGNPGQFKDFQFE